MSKPRVVITGVGVLAGNGEGKDAFWQALADGKVGYNPITLFDAESFNVRQAGEVVDFDPKKYMGPKGLRTLDRSTKLLCSAARLAIDDCGFEIAPENTDDVGVSVGCTLGSLKSLNDFDEVTLKEGPRYTNPSLFPNTVINSPASQVSIWNKIEGFNTTISTGFTASIDAIEYASMFIQLERAKVVYAGGVEELCETTFYGFHTAGFLSGSKEGEHFINCPFDARRNGITFGEGACLLALEEMNHAKDRDANVYAEVLGFGICFDPTRFNKYNPRATGLIQSIRLALEEARCEPSDIDYICSNANSTVLGDKTETTAIKEIFGTRSSEIPVSAIKSMIGETYSVSGALAVASAVGTLQSNVIPPTINYQEADPECDLDYVPNVAREKKVDKILILSFGPNGNCASMIIGRH